MNDTNMGQNASNGLVIPAEIRAFLEGLLSDAGMTYTDDELKEEMINELFARLDQYIASVIVSELPSDKVDEFIQMNEEKKSQQEMEVYIKAHIPNSNDVFTKAFVEFRKMYLGGTSSAPASGSSEGSDASAPQPYRND